MGVPEGVQRTALGRVRRGAHGGVHVVAAFRSCSTRWAATKPLPPVTSTGASAGFRSHARSPRRSGSVMIPSTRHDRPRVAGNRRGGRAARLRRRPARRLPPPTACRAPAGRAGRRPGRVRAAHAARRAPRPRQPRPAPCGPGDRPARARAVPRPPPPGPGPTPPATGRRAAESSPTKAAAVLAAPPRVAVADAHRLDRAPGRPARPGTPPAGSAPGRGRTRCCPPGTRRPPARRAARCGDPCDRGRQGAQPVAVDEQHSAARGQRARHRPPPDLGLGQHPGRADGGQQRDVQPGDVVGDEQQPAGGRRGGAGHPDPHPGRPDDGPAPARTAPAGISRRTGDSTTPASTSTRPP